MLGGYKTQGRDAEAAYQLIKNVIEFEKAGAVAVVVESVPQEVARIIYEKLSIPFLGTGAGPYSDSPMINLYDLLGFFERTPRFAKRYANLKEIAVEATNTFVSEVRKQIYPGPEHCYNMHEGEYDKLVSLCKDL
jgi:3-methyl-2-oxobutanoate hydroxymethyltransferase